MGVSSVLREYWANWGKLLLNFFLISGLSKRAVIWLIKIAILKHLIQLSDNPLFKANVMIDLSSAICSRLKPLKLRAKISWLLISSEKHWGKPKPVARKAKIVLIHFSQCPQLRAFCFPWGQTLNSSDASFQEPISLIFSIREKEAPSWIIEKVLFDSRWSVMGWEPQGVTRAS